VDVFVGNLLAIVFPLRFLATTNGEATEIMVFYDIAPAFAEYT
jgi:hypothetical protein